MDPPTSSTRKLQKAIQRGSKGEEQHRMERVVNTSRRLDTGMAEGAQEREGDHLE